MKETKDFTSLELKNEFLKVMSNTILRKQIKQTLQAQFYAIMADKIVDSSKEKLVICLRCVDVDSNLMKVLLECTILITQKHQQSLKDVFQRFYLFICDRVRGQCYDMTSSMAGLYLELCLS